MPASSDHAAGATDARDESCPDPESLFPGHARYRLYYAQRSPAPGPWDVTYGPGGTVVFQSRGGEAGTALHIQAGGSLDASGQISAPSKTTVSFHGWIASAKQRRLATR